MEGYLRGVSDSQICPADKTLALQVLFQLLAQKATQIRIEQLDGDAKATLNGVPIPAFLYVKALHEKVRSLRSAISDQTSHQGKLLRAAIVAVVYAY